MWRWAVLANCIAATVDVVEPSQDPRSVDRGDGSSVCVCVRFCVSPIARKLTTWGMLGMDG